MLHNVDLLVSYKNYDNSVIQMKLVFRGIGIIVIILDLTKSESIVDIAAIEQSTLWVIIQMVL